MLSHEGFASSAVPWCLVVILVISSVHVVYLAEKGKLRDFWRLFFLCISSLLLLLALS